MVGIQYFLYEDVPLVRGHTFYPDSPWALTTISQPQFWRDLGLFRTRYGDGEVGGLISVDISDWDTPGRSSASGEAVHARRDRRGDVAPAQGRPQRIDPRGNGPDRRPAPLVAPRRRPRLLDGCRRSTTRACSSTRRARGRCAPTPPPRSPTSCSPPTTCAPTPTSRRWRAHARPGAARSTRSSIATARLRRAHGLAARGAARVRAVEAPRRTAVRRRQPPPVRAAGRAPSQRRARAPAAHVRAHRTRPARRPARPRAPHGPGPAAPRPARRRLTWAHTSVMFGCDFLQRRANALDHGPRRFTDPVWRETGSERLGQFGNGHPGELVPGQEAPSLLGRRQAEEPGIEPGLRVARRAAALHHAARDGAGSLQATGVDRREMVQVVRGILPQPVVHQPTSIHRPDPGERVVLVALLEIPPHAVSSMGKRGPKNNRRPLKPA